MSGRRDTPPAVTRVRACAREVRPRPPDDPVVRFETPPGLQGRAGSASFRLPWGRRHALAAVLGHSRLLLLRYYPRQTMAHLTEGLESAFAAFGGVPRELLSGQMRAVAAPDDREAGGGITVNASALRGPLGLHAAGLQAVPGGQGQRDEKFQPWAEVLLQQSSSSCPKDLRRGLHACLQLPSGLTALLFDLADTAGNRSGLGAQIEVRST